LDRGDSAQRAMSWAVLLTMPSMWETVCGTLALDTAVFLGSHTSISHWREQKQSCTLENVLLLQHALLVRMCILQD
jgi:hypothetical protein